MKKRFSIISVCIVLCLILLGSWGYNTYFKADPEVEVQLYDQFGEDFFSFDTEEPDVHEKPVVVGQNNTDSEKGSQVLDKVQPVSNGEDSHTKVVTQEEIANKYKSQFERLQNAGLSRLDSLFSAAAHEYEENKKSGTLNRSELLKKYLQAGKTMEVNMDSQFYSSLSQMEAELKAHNLPTDSVSKYGDIYEKAKSSKKAELFAKLQ